MYDLTQYQPRYWQLKLMDGSIINVLPPKVNQTRKITRLAKSLAKSETDTIELVEVTEDLYKAYADIFSRNKEEKKVTIDEIGQLTQEQLIDLTNAFYEWVNSLQTKN